MARKNENRIMCNEQITNSSLAEIMFNIGDLDTHESLEIMDDLLKSEEKLISFNTINQDGSDTDNEEFLNPLSQFVAYGLDRFDILVISRLWHNYLHGDCMLEVSELLKRIYVNPINAYANINKIRKLIYKGMIIDASNEKDNHPFLAMVKIEKDDNFYRSDIKLSQSFVDYITGKAQEFQCYDESPFYSNNEYLSAWINLWKAAYALYLNAKTTTVCEPDMYYLEHQLVKQMLSIMENKEGLTTINLFYKEFRDHFNLTINDILLLTMVIYLDADNIKETIQKIQNGFLENRYKMHSADIANIESSQLILHDIVRIASYSPEDERFTEYRQLCLSPWVKPVIHGTSCISRNNHLNRDELLLANVLQEVQYFDLVIPKFCFNDLIVEPKLEHSLQQIISLKHYKTKNLLSKWGVDGFEKGINSRGYSILLYGAPGTGKTLAAEVVAFEMGKKIIKTDSNHILSKWFSQAEKNAKAVFQKYYWLCHSMQNPPILLFNEADQILNSRMNYETCGTDKTWNAIQNIILESLENPQGMIIATTNLLGNFDEAYSRRFDMILEFKRPEYHERVRIWRARLPYNLPGVDKLDINLLAEYALSGGQISKVIRNACLYLASLPRKNKITTAILVTCCQDEVSNSFDHSHKPKRNIGFHLVNHILQKQEEEHE